MQVDTSSVLIEILKVVLPACGAGVAAWVAASQSAAKAYEKTRAEETAKINTLSRNIDQVLNNTEKLTSLQEGIKSQLAANLWERQQRWQYVFETYAQVLCSLDRMYLDHVKCLIAFDRNDPSAVPVFDSDQKESSKQLRVALAKSRLILGSEATDLFIEFFDQHLAVNSPNLRSQIETRRDLCVQYMEKFGELGRRSLSEVFSQVPETHAGTGSGADQTNGRV